MANILLLNGPNLNLLGSREPDIYGHETLTDVEASVRTVLENARHSLRAEQSNREYELIDWVHDARDDHAAIIINPGAFTHTSIALLDAFNAYEGFVFEVHISNVHKRESFRHHSYIGLRADGIIVGCGVQGYELAARRVVTLLSQTD
ncbi:type II 3-dehydroquinate dehydratase [Notoacmeibacter sp. MSK16QG-6]|uniref:type II 3-dehydroquinate dehydratase n=1 Tax=Notoacmeibacter sp. MSK16QG-6 TaxID=2957982 RepID=UPI00209D3123|nr:type II 3-dehydroquinate dehydratase [Notoacmeibacter sp. MSK16QG-6]